ncbi:enoyl-CoA hydratase/carnithine racemase [Bacillus mesophilus]|uniref:Enoyl-CoA hydratase n=1 Tax=Bacillus mesophilus TaxID=1808955 RepID=A0A6M0Q3N1_9BACI|nr:enoyl-CoA hydratase [Bacillus mesophilus]MBM7659943.1 enoyl-CoA hydratase/carnithine racemase [Bacillus mesophilus]NEY70804.1 enoyl-CoA hydratase [Bacillus mesophilus]
MSGTVLLEKHNGVITITLNRPEAYNSLDVPMLEELLELLNKAAQMEENILVIKGSGKGFSAGGDIKTMLSSFDTPFESIMETIGAVVTALYEMPKLTICAIHGAAAGLGLSLALACDHVMVDERAKVAMNFIGIGLVPDGGGHFFLKQRLGDKKARSVIWEGKTLAAEEALEIGVIDEVTGDLEEAVTGKIAAWQEKPVQAMIATKLIYVNIQLDELKSILKLETHNQGKMRVTEDHKEGVSAFLEKRKPQFVGK